VLRVIQVLKVL
jgi:hypothetical protein